MPPRPGDRRRPRTLAWLALLPCLAAAPDGPGVATVSAPGGRPLRLEAPRGGALALVFYSTECPIANACNPALNALVRRFPRERFVLVGLCVDEDLTDAQVAAHAQEYELAFPVGRDRGLAQARRHGITVTPEAIVLDAAGRPRYRGRIDDQFVARSKRNRHAQAHDLRDAIEAVLDGREVARPRTPAVGCPLPAFGPAAPSRDGD
jgi:hypothetical protein